MQTVTNFTWEHLEPSLSPEILNILKTELEFDKVTKVQGATIPLLLTNKDVCVKACTGSGKSLAFILPLIQTLQNFMKAELLQEDLEEKKSVFEKNDVFGLLLAPSRELAMQISKVLGQFMSILAPHMNFCYFIGGDKLDYDLERIEDKGANIVIATPGRLYDLVCKEKVLNLRKLEVLVLDEADKLME